MHTVSHLTKKYWVLCTCVWWRPFNKEKLCVVYLCMVETIYVMTIYFQLHLL